MVKLCLVLALTLSISVLVSSTNVVLSGTLEYVYYVAISGILVGGLIVLISEAVS